MEFMSKQKQNHSMIKYKKNDKYKMKMKLKRSNESVDERNKQLHLDRFQYMKK